MINQTLPKEFADLAAVQNKNENKLLALPNVCGVALGRKITGGVESDEDVITVLVNQKFPPELLSRGEKVPTKISDVRTDVVEVGELFAGDRGEAGEGGGNTIQAAFSPSLTRRVRPAMGGFSVGHYKVTAGTLGTCCYDLEPFPGFARKCYILSNNHVLANSNDAQIGDPILQPGLFDGGLSPELGDADIIARLSRFVPIKYHSGGERPCNYVDAAIAEGDLQDLSREIYWGGHLKRLYVAPKIGDVVQKTGRTTGFTTGTITNINATVDVNYGSGRIARFCRQIITNAMSAGGDSGSLVCNLDEGAVGLLFAGSTTHTIINNIAFVQLALKIRLTET